MAAFSPPPIHKEPYIENSQKPYIWDEDLRRAPWDAVDFKARDGPEKRRGKETIRVRGNVKKDVQAPCGELPDGTAEERPEHEKEYEENDETMRELVELADIMRNVG